MHSTILWTRHNTLGIFPSRWTAHTCLGFFSAQVLSAFSLLVDFHRCLRTNSRFGSSGDMRKMSRILLQYFRLYVFGCRTFLLFPSHLIHLMKNSLSTFRPISSHLIIIAQIRGLTGGTPATYGGCLSLYREKSSAFPSPVDSLSSSNCEHTTLNINI